MREFVENKTNQWLLVFKTLIIIVIGSIYSVFFINDYGWLNSLFMMSGLISIGLCFVPVLLVSKAIDLNTLIKMAQTKIRSWIFKKYGYDPSMIADLQDSIKIKNNEINSVGEELNSIRSNKNR